MPAYRKADSKDRPVSSAAEIRRFAGPVTDDTVVAILETGASVEELEAATIHARGEGDAIDRLGHHMAGKVAQLYDILVADELFANNDR